jgi:signal transduction histidine kinase
MIKVILSIVFLLMPSFIMANTSTVIDWTWQRYQTNNVSELVVDNVEIKWETPNANALFDVNASHGVIGWYKTSFNWNDSVSRPALFIKSVHHSDKIWLNGHFIGGLGQLQSAWAFGGIAPHNRHRLYPVDGLLKPNNNQLVIKVNIGFGSATGALYPGGIGFSQEHIEIVELSAGQLNAQNMLLSDIAIDTTVLILSLVDLLLIFFLFRQTIHRFPEFKWLFISSALMLAGILGLDLPYLLNISFEQQKLLFMLLMLTMPLLTMMFFVSLHQDKREKWLLYLGIVITLIGMLTLVPMIPDDLKNMCWKIWGAFAKGFYVVALFCAIASVIKKFDGAMTGLIGLVVYIISIRTQWLPNDLLEHRNIVIGTLFFRYALLFSYIQRINQMSLNHRVLSKHLLNVVEEQRKMMARELHDGLGQHLTGAKLQLQLAQSLQQDKHINLVKSELDNGISLVRKMINGLHPFNLETKDLNYVVIQDTKRLAILYDITVDVMINGEHIPASSGVHIMRIIQESINNAVRHGGADCINICVEEKNSKVSLIIRDNGIGLNGLQEGSSPNDSSGGFGHISLTERVAIINGTISIKNATKGGTKIVIEFPLV